MRRSRRRAKNAPRTIPVIWPPERPFAAKLVVFGVPAAVAEGSLEAEALAEFVEEEVSEELGLGDTELLAVPVEAVSVFVGDAVGEEFEPEAMLLVAVAVFVGADDDV